MPPKAQPIAIRIELQEIAPLIWRRIVVSNHWTLGSLHNYLQWVMGWQDSHAHEFRVGERCIGPDWWIQEIDPMPSMRIRLWIGGVFDPQGFDLNRLNRDCKPGRRSLR